MVYDMRTYTLKPGALQTYMDAVRDIGLPVRQKYGVKLAGWYDTEIRVTHSAPRHAGGQGGAAGGV